MFRILMLILQFTLKVLDWDFFHWSENTIHSAYLTDLYSIDFCLDHFRGINNAGEFESLRLCTVQPFIQEILGILHSHHIHRTLCQPSNALHPLQVRFVYVLHEWETQWEKLKFACKNVIPANHTALLFKSQNSRTKLSVNVWVLCLWHTSVGEGHGILQKLEQGSWVAPVGSAET